MHRKDESRKERSAHVNELGPARSNQERLESFSNVDDEERSEDRLGIVLLFLDSLGKTVSDDVEGEKVACLMNRCWTKTEECMRVSSARGRDWREMDARLARRRSPSFLL